MDPTGSEFGGLLHVKLFWACIFFHILVSALYNRKLDNQDFFVSFPVALLCMELLWIVADMFPFLICKALMIW